MASTYTLLCVSQMSVCHNSLLSVHFCRLVQGMTLQQYCHEFFTQGQLAASEDRMLAIGAQLFDVSTANHCK